MKQLMKTDKSGIMKLPPKGKIDFGEMLLREQLFKKGINPGMIKNEKQLDNILDTPAVPKSERVKPKKSGEVIEVNDALEENPELVNTSPYEEGWFFKLKVSDENLGSTDSLMTAEEYSSMLDGNS